jgi:hypothetical protein
MSDYEIGEKLANDLIEKCNQNNFTAESTRFVAMTNMAQYMEERQYNYEVMRAFISTINSQL